MVTYGTFSGLLMSRTGRLFLFSFGIEYNSTTGLIEKDYKIIPESKKLSIITSAAGKGKAKYSPF